MTLCEDTLVGGETGTSKCLHMVIMKFNPNSPHFKEVYLMYNLSEDTLDTWLCPMGVHNRRVHGHTVDE